MDANIIKNQTGTIHIVGICGVATSALAIAFHNKGWHVTGSDKGFYPPVSTALEKAGISFHAGWHPEKIGVLKEDGTVKLPDFIVAGGIGTSLSNPEIVFAKEHGIKVLSFAEALGTFFIKKNSIVTVGTWGKTTTSAILSFILIEAGLKPSYFTGGLSLSHDTGALSDTDWSVVEGDEYQAAIWDKKPKFAYYSPTHLLFTSVSWDHADLYPTEKDYFETFEKLAASIPKHGLIVYCADDKGVEKVIRNASPRANTISYGKDANSTYRYHSVSQSRNGISFSIDYKKSGDDTAQTFSISSPMLGSFNAENIAGCFAMAHSIGIDPNKICQAIADFKGIKRRLEKKHEGSVTIFDCHAPTGDKVSSVLDSLREVYPTNKIIAVFEPNIGGRQRSSIAMYDRAFLKTDYIFLPHFTKTKIDPNETTRPLEASELVEYISRTTPNVSHIEDDEELIKSIINTTKKGDVIVFLGSHGFRGMIEKLTEAYLASS